MKDLLLYKPFIVVSIYLLAGLCLGLLDPEACRWIGGLGVKPGLATALSVNGLMPLLAVLLGIAFPRFGTALIGAVALTWGFLVGLMIRYTPDNAWNVGELLRSVPPLLLAACLAYAVIGILTVKGRQVIWK
ncbi:MAG: hypothetical protein ACJ8FY_14255 [Gemmataceae bacterium]